ncbi:Glu-tRNA(Gln) amidotransferase subunit GatE [Candidatus Woesearchaeota archaeon]|nr:Glu-tRNA(Gln) amidotransferase subunit GatE [Candidatus Woesearchaeota archaeon]
MDIDYKKLGFKCGLEIHQQLEGKKLFCSCPTINSSRESDVKFERKLRAVAGEQGQVDVAASHEMQKSRKFVYEANSEDTCLVEYDEEPPKQLNRAALETALKISLLLNATPVDEIQFMRKTVVDGSNVSGFQRTALIALDGNIETSLGTVRISTICLEEEAAQKLESKKDYVKYKLDRLGIPLIEIATDVDIKNAEHAKEAASKIGMILRSVDNVKRGLGTIRQDVNVSIEQGERVEIKGFQDLKSIPKVIDYEVNRQIFETENGKKLEKEVRKAEPNFTTSFLRPMPGSARLYPETDVSPVGIEKHYLDELKKNLPRLLSEKIGEIEKKHKLKNDLARELVDNEHFEKLIKKFSKLEPSLIANTLISIPKEIKSRLKLDPSSLVYDDFHEVLDYLHKGKVAKDVVIDLLVKKIKKEKIILEKYVPISDKDLEADIKDILEKRKGLNIGAYMGILMGKYKGSIEGKKLMQILKKLLK